MFLLKSYKLLNVEKTYQQSNKIARWVAPTLNEIRKRRKKLGRQPPNPRSEFLEWNYEAEIIAFGKRLGEQFNRDVLKTALIDKSYEEKNNTELIEKGELIISDYLNESLSKYPKDIAESLKKYLTTEEMLSHVGTSIGLKDIVLTKEYPAETTTLSNSFKAVIGALDPDRTKSFLEDFLLVQLNGKDPIDIWNCEKPVDYLNKVLKERDIEEPEPRLCNESGKNTVLANYQVGWYSNKKLLGIGWGESIDIAKNTAALDAIKKLYNIH